MTDTITQDQAIEFAKKAGFKACVGTTDKEGNYHPFVNALGKDIPIEWVVRLCNLVALSQQAEPASVRQAFIRGWDERGIAHQLGSSVDTDDSMRTLLNVYFPQVAQQANQVPDPMTLMTDALIMEVAQGWREFDAPGGGNSVVYGACRAVLNKYRDLLAAAPKVAQQAEQAGLVRVPVEPTIEMLDAARNECADYTFETAHEIYRAMLGAAPKGGVS